MNRKAAKYYRRVLALWLCLCLSPQAPSAQEVQVFSIGSGDITGNYYPAARAICDTFNSADDTRRRCSPEPTPGTIYNLQLLHEGELDFAVAQSDWLRAAYAGEPPFVQFGAMTDLRLVTPLFPEEVTILISAGSGITTQADLVGKVVDIGRPSSGRAATIRTLLTRFGMDESAFGATRELDAGTAVDELCLGHIDATILVVGHPNALVEKALKACRARIVALTGPEVDRIVSESSDYRKGAIDLAPYGYIGHKIETVAVTATLITRNTTEDRLVADLLKAVKREAAVRDASLPDFQVSDPATDDSATSIPVHPGATAGL